MTLNYLRLKYAYPILAIILLLFLAACGSPAAPGPAPAAQVTATPVPPSPSPAPLPPSPSPTLLPPSPTPVPPTASPTPAAPEVPPATLAAEIQATVAASLPPTSTPDADGFTMGGFNGVSVLPLTGEDRPLWAVFSHGIRSFDPLINHFIAIYSHDETGWQEINRLELPDPDYIDPAGVTQVQVEPSHLWLEVPGGAGAHSGTYNLVSFDGQVLKIELSHFHDSPGAGRLEDLNGDGTPEAILDQTNNYVFCYACGVRQVFYAVYQWDGAQFREVTLAPLPASAPADLRKLNDRAVELAQAGLWKDAQAAIDEAAKLAQGEPAVTWNAALIHLHAENQAKMIADGAYPLLENIFYGDYAAALAVMQPYSPEQLFSQPNPLIAGTVAEGWEMALSDAITTSTTLALTAEPDLAPAYFLRGWAIYLANPAAPAAALADIEQAAALKPDEPLFAKSAAYLKNK